MLDYVKDNDIERYRNIIAKIRIATLKPAFGVEFRKPNKVTENQHRKD